MMETRDEFGLIFPVPVLLSQVADHERLNEALLDDIGRLRKDTPNGRPNTWSGTVYTTLNTNSLLHQRPAFRPFRDLILQQANKFANELQFDVSQHPLRITSCWANIYGRGDSQEVHNHANSVFSGVYYVKAAEGAAGLFLISPTGDMMLDPPIRKFTSPTAKISRIEAKPGTMILFPSWLRHSVPASQIDEERISVSFNLLI